MTTDRADEPFGVRGGARTTQRRGRMSEAKRESLARLAPRWLVDPVEISRPGHLDAAFGRAAPRLLDIGGGTGEATRAWAAENPDHDVVALELHRPGIVRLLRVLDAEGPANVRVAEADATVVLDALEPGAFASIRALFPDPWPKRRHVGRRLVDPGFVATVVGLLPVGGTLHLATDWADYADQMRTSLATDLRLDVEVVLGAPAGEVTRVPVAEVGSLVPAPAAVPGEAPGPPPWRSPRPPRPVTAYEQRGIDAGREIVDLVAHRAR
ncbi:hypothetical protein KSP35_14370 [Aquihabitans sp. G128]|uniref:tRNA (guanine(46)-N(7))-methyltransferase TrmB n=1 Tax=Aquihabitans sp. G128 TaxID=2849779 RepID=UPI001C223458|nr:hypothetical protein [Aquihabitans sp. G128]QXC59568.1 hypothetical protein KSP35_14370 [Aquihabitans sp. G128]